MLSCDCGYYDEISWYYCPPSDFTTLQQKRRKRCCSCQKLIEPNAVCLECERNRDTRTDIEERIYGDEVPLSSWFLCEGCGEIYLNLSKLGYCIRLGDYMPALLAEYWTMTGFEPKENP